VVLIGSETKGRQMVCRRAGAVIATALAGRSDHHAHRPDAAARKALAKAGLTIDQIDLFEVTEAFAAVPMRFMKELVCRLRVNVNAARSRWVIRSVRRRDILGTLLERAGAQEPALRLPRVCWWRDGDCDDHREVCSRVSKSAAPWPSRQAGRRIKMQTIRYTKSSDGIVTLTFDEPDSPSTRCARNGSVICRAPSNASRPKDRSSA